MPPGHGALLKVANMTSYISLMILLFPGILALEGPLCDDPSFLDHGYIQITHKSLNGMVYYYCHDGYWYTGTLTRVCQADGQWSGTTGFCKAVECPSLADPSNGKLEVNGTAFENQATVTCDAGYIYSDPQFNPRICQGDNTWTSKGGTCDEVRCPDLPEPAHGSIRYSGNGFGNKADIICNTGFVYTKPESTTRTCQGDNTWSLQFDGECQKVSCPPIPDVENRVVSSNNSFYKSNITVFCKSGYVLEGAEKITCLANGLWSSRPGNCLWSRQLMFLLLLLVVPALGLLLICIVKFVRSKFRRKEGDAGEYKLTEQDYDECYHCSFILKKKFDAGNSVPTSPEYTSFAAKIIEKVERTIKVNSGRDDVKVSVSHISQQKMTVFLEILCPKTISEDKLREWITLDNNIIGGSVQFRHQVTASLAAEIINKEHVIDTHFDRSIELDSQYVKLRLLSNKVMTNIQRDEIELLPDKYQANLSECKGKDIEDENLITPGEIYIVIRGRAGIGKTTLIQRLMRRWALGEWAKDLKAIFLLNLRVLAAIHSSLDIEYILTQCGVYRISSGLSANWLKENEEYIGIVLDGLDEIPRFEAQWKEMDPKSMEKGDKVALKPLQWCLSLLRRESMPKATLIVTSRPFPGLNYLKQSTMVEVMGLTRQSVMDFIDINVKRRWIDKVKQSMKNNPILMSVSAITFYCASLCHVLQNDIDIVEKLTTYTEITAYIMKDFIYRSMKNPNEAYSLKQDSKSISSMCQMAYQGLLQGQPQRVFSEKDYGKDLKQIDVDVTRKAGLFYQTEIQNTNDHDGTQVQGEFVHLCIQELMAVVGLLMQTPEDIKKALTMLFTSGQFNMSLLFLYGFVFNRSSETIQNLWSSVAGDAEINTLIPDLLTDKICDVNDKLLLLQIVHESQSPKLAKKVGERKFQRVEFQETKLTAVDVLALGFLLKHHSTSSIKLCDVGLDTFGIKELSQFLKSNNSVTSVTLKDEEIDDQCVKYLADLMKVNRALTHIDIDSDNMTDKGVTSLIEGLKANNVLRHLRVASDNVTEKGVKAIAYMLGANKCLTNLEITSNRVTDEGLVSLASALTQNQVLEKLILPGTNARDEGVKALLHALTQNKTATVQFFGTGCISPELMAKVRTQHRIITG